MGQVRRIAIGKVEIDIPPLRLKKTTSDISDADTVGEY